MCPAHLWEPGDNASGLRYDARQRLEAYRARLEAAGAMAHMDAISPIDEPNPRLPRQSGSIVAAVAIIRDVFPRPARALHLRRLPRAVQPGAV